ncbi:MAG TPA: pyruvate:ferredoxin (flavodoxin) oxidoreductase [Myxococcales bacterium]|nr:pyruvate:ferredoxin (flavodoxin) oxidoreductase [Myxococcales bacterium]
MAKLICDGNEAVARVAYRASEVVAIYPITPASPMGEMADEWSAHAQPNLWGAVPSVVEMQSEAGAAGAVHGSLQAGALATTFTASQGLLLMIPNLYKIAGELTSFCMHVAARTVATHALSIFGDHSDVMACRQTGFAMLASGSVQEAHDFAAVAHAATLRARLPFLHFFDGFRTSHEIARIEALSDDDLRALLPEALVAAHRGRALTPDRPVIRGTAQNPDTFFQAREAVNPFYAGAPSLVQQVMDELASRTGRAYHLFDYAGDPEADRVVVLMGSGAEVAHEAVDWLNARGGKVGVLKVRLYRPFDSAAFLAALPASVRSVAVLDRTKEPGAPGEPLYLDTVAALAEGERQLRVRGGRYGLSSKEFTPAMMLGVFDELARPESRNHFTVGIVDDVTHHSLAWDRELDVEPEDVARAVFYGLGSDGTVGANKSSIKIIGEETDDYVQGYFVYDSKKSGSLTTSHLRFGPRPIRSSYLIRRAGFVACHQSHFLERTDVLACAAPGATFLLNSPKPPAEVWDGLPREVQAEILEKKLRLFAVDAERVAAASGLSGLINTVMQSCYFALAGILPRDQAVAAMKREATKSYKKKGPEVVARNCEVIDRALAALHEIPVPADVSSKHGRPPLVPDEAPDFVKRVTAVMLANQGDLLPVSAFPVDGTWPSGTGAWEKRELALEIPVWDERLCIQCNKCALVCPHAAIRAKVAASDRLADAPTTFKHTPYRGHEWQGMDYVIQVAPEDCTGCSLCTEVCPAKDETGRKALVLAPEPPLREAERANLHFFLGLPEADRTRVKLDVKGVEFFQPLFEFSGACAGCGETPYLKLLSQLFGDRALIANATGCSSIYGGNLPTTPWAVNAEGHGPAWSNSLFEDDAEFGLGFRLALDEQAGQARSLLRALAPQLPEALVQGLGAADGSELALREQRARVAALRQRLATIDRSEARRLEQLADALVRKSVWIVGGDGWAYDIGYGGLDHVLALGRDVNILVLDTEVYSNTGGQQSKATPLGAAARFAAAGKARPGKDLGMLAMTYGNVYVAQVAFGVKDAQMVQAFREAESFPGPSLILAYSQCIAHGYDLACGLSQQKLAVESGHWPLYRFDPRRQARGEPAFKLDSAPPKIDVADYMRNESRFRVVAQQDPERYAKLVAASREEIAERYRRYRELASEAGMAGSSGVSEHLSTN